MYHRWVIATLGSLMDVKHGYAFPGSGIHDEPQGDILLTPGNFAIGGGFKGDRFRYFTGDVPEEFVLEEGDLLVTMTDLSKQADTLGYPAFVPRPDRARFLHNQRLGKVIIRPGANLDKHFLFYLLHTPEYRSEVLAGATGTTVKHTSPSRILAYRAAIPPLCEQQTIASILGALDDKIELNARMNRTLEEMARAVFKSWFVDFDPVRTKMEGRRPVGMDDATATLFPDSFEESELGPVPRGWRVGPLLNAVVVNPVCRMPGGRTAPYVEMSRLPTTGARITGYDMREFTSGTRFMNGDTVMARITPCLENGKTALVDFLADGETAWGSTEFIVLRSKPPFPPEYSYMLARTAEFRTYAIQSMCGSSGRQRVPASALDAYPIVIPASDVLNAFGQFASSCMMAMRAHDVESSTLCSIRDTLLPRLISGEVRVGDAVETVEVTV